MVDADGGSRYVYNISTKPEDCNLTHQIYTSRMKERKKQRKKVKEVGCG